MDKHDIQQPDLDYDVKPVGAWVVGGFVMTAVIVIWALVSFLFLHRA